MSAIQELYLYKIYGLLSCMHLCVSLFRPLQGYGFVNYATTEQAQMVHFLPALPVLICTSHKYSRVYLLCFEFAFLFQAISALNNYSWEGKRLKVDFKSDKQK